jgi:glycosyltransferase involved in cell wall biosynthesis
MKACRVDETTMTNRPKVLIYTNSLLAGSMTFIKSHAESLKRYQAVYVGSRRISGLSLPEDRTYVANTGGLRGRLSEGVFRFTGWAPSLIHKLESVKPKAIHAHFGTSAPAALHLGKALSIPLVVTFHGRDATIDASIAAKSWRGRELQFFFRRVRDEASTFIAVSNHIRNCLLQSGYPTERIVVHRNGIDMRFFEPDPSVPREPIIVFVGRFVEKKGAEYLVSAARRMLDDNLVFRLVLIGDGPLRPKLEQLAAKMNVPVEFPGFIPTEEIRRWLNKAAVAAVPSVTASDGDSEGLPTIVIEAQSMEVPVVGTIHSGIPEAIDDGKTGFLVPERDVDALAASLKALLTDEEMRSDFGRAARCLVSDRFDMDKQINGLEQIYATAIDRGDTVCSNVR